ncbi:hypothetical protein [Hoylesella timonensis]|jgi:hypothetical protein|uniref:hypothetical protein n=1 Tax=Hoylesella timonensis TaxID=386414 RepID=UPI00288A0E23|nr:hypothetical protein [Hoylesella timonensis]
MKKSTQEKEIEKLKKLVEKLKNDKESLQRDNRNLKGRLSTAQSNNVKYRSALKKKEKPSVGLNKETFEQLMNLLDDIITPV